MNISLIGKTALVCGSTQGIGKATALELASLGATIILLARNEEKLKESLKELDTSHGQKHTFLVADFSNPTMLKSTIVNFLQEGHKIHILINNSGFIILSNIQFLFVTKVLGAVSCDISFGSLFKSTVITFLKVLFAV